MENRRQKPAEYGMKANESSNDRFEKSLDQNYLKERTKRFALG